MNNYIPWIKTSGANLLILTIVFMTISIGNAYSTGNTVLENSSFRYEISENGQNLHFIDKSSGKDFLDHSVPTKFSEIMLGGKLIPVKNVKRKGNQLQLTYEGLKGNVNVLISGKDDRINLKVISAPNTIESLTLLNAPLTLEAQPYEPFAACVLSMNLFTHVRLLPPLQKHLWARCYKKFGIVGAEITLLGLPHDKILPTVRDVMTNASGVPKSEAGGAWASISKEGYGSYLMNFGTLTEQTVDEWIETCKSLGFNQIDSHGGGGFFDFGTLELNKQKWPDGWESFRRINAKLHQNGISHIFHTYAFFIDKNTKYVSPLPHKDLGYVQTFTLAEPLGAGATEVTVNESTAHVSTITGFHTENSVTLRIGDELIEFSEVTKTAPFKFKGLRRGANKTVVSAHKTGAPAYHLSERFNRFVPDPNSGLFNEIAKKHADIVNDCGFDGIYLDAIDGGAVLAGEANFWYYGTKFVFEIAKNLKKSVGMEMSSMSHHWWHYRSRWQAWDRAVRGYKRSIDIHLASIKNPSLFLPGEIKSNEWEHGLWRGNTPLINKFAAVKNGQTMLPLHLGWWGNQTWSPPQIEPTFPDDIEYLAVKMLANNAGYSQLGGVDKKTLDSIPLFRKAAEIIKQYEGLRYQKYFKESVLDQLLQPGKEFTLVQDPQEGLTFKPRTYKKHKVVGLEHESKKWVSHNEFEAQPLKLRIEPLMSVKPYDDPSAILLTDFSEKQDFKVENQAEGVSGQVGPARETTETQEKTGAFTAMNTGKTPSDATFINLERQYNELISLKDNQGIGVWIRGDGNGQLLNLSVRSPNHISHGAHGDRFIKVDFVGWKYFELVEIESSAISDYIWPDDSHFYVYDSYRHVVSFDKIEKFQLWYNNLPSGKAVRTVIGPVKALPLVEKTISNPSITIGNNTITFPVTMKSGMYLEYFSNDNCKLYDSNGKVIQEVTVRGEVPILSAGTNEILLDCETSKDINPRIQVTVISEGLPLRNVKK